MVIKLNKKILTSILICFIVLGSLTIIYFKLIANTKNFPSSGVEEYSESELSDAILNSINFIKNSSEPHTLLWLDVIYRRFGIESFSFAYQRYDQLLEEKHIQTSSLRVFRRIIDYNNPLQINDLNSIVVDLDQITVPALYCDRLDLTQEYSEELEKASENGGYHLTHVLLALVWIQENGCQVPLSEDLIEKIYRKNAELINDDSMVEDLELEAAAFLFLADKGPLVPNSFINKVLETQNTDGSWGTKTQSWHTTVLGLLLLLHIKFPSHIYVTTLAQPNLG